MSEITKHFDSHNIIDSDMVFVVDPFTRQITSENPQKYVIMRGDHNSERFTFKIPRYIEGHDMYLCNHVAVPYLNFEGRKKGQNYTTGVYLSNDIHVDPEDESMLVFSWLISGNATKFAGGLSFSVLMSCMNGKIVEYRWGSDSYNQIAIADNLYSDISFGDEYVDVIEQWKETVRTEFTAYIDQISNLRFTEIQNLLTEKLNGDIVTLTGNMDEKHEAFADLIFNQLENFKALIQGYIDGFDEILKREINDMDSEIDILKARMDTFTSLPEGATVSEAELQDISVDFEGNKHVNAGTAVREQAKKLNYGITAVEQKDLSINPFQPLLVDAYCYYKGSDVGRYPDAMYVPKYNSVNFEEYKELENDNKTSSYSVGGRLLSPIPVFNEPNGEYVVVIKTNVDIPGYLYFGHQFNWAPTNTNWNKRCDLKAGYNIVYVKGGTIRDSGHTDYRYVFYKTDKVEFVEHGVTTFEMYVVRGDSLIGYIDETANYVADNARFSLNARNALNAYNSGASRLQINEYISNIDKTPDSGMYSIEETSTGYRFILSEENHIKENTDKWFQGFATNLGKKSEAIKKTIMFKVKSNDETCTKQSLSRLVLHNTFYNWNGAPINQGIVKVADVNLSAYGDNDDIYLIWGISAGVDGKSEWNETTCDMTVTLLEITDGYVLADELKGFDPKNYFTKEEIKTQYDPPVKNIICWGDSLTAMGGWTTKLASLSGMKVVNCGTGGENSNVIASRQGADCIVIDNFTIPADTRAVKIADYTTRFKTYMGHVSAPLLQGGTSHVNPVMLGNVEGTLAWNDPTGIWTFTRSVAGKEVIINRPTHLTTYADRTYNDGNNIHIFFVGTNDGAFDVDEMINKLHLMIDHSKTHEYLILGLTRIQSAGYKEKFKAAFGRKWLDLHGYLVAYGLDDAGIKPVTEDITAIKADLVPPSLLTDSVHYTEKTRELIGIQVYNRLRDLHYIH